MAEKHDYPDAVDRHDRLRRSARDMLDRGASPRNSGATLSVDALQLLYQRASTPESAADALRLLHELQTYQVELDLLYEQLQDNEQEITEGLAHYKSLFDLAPAAYLVVTNDGEIIEGNQSAGVLFRESPGQLAGKPLSALLAPGQQGTVDALLQSSGERASGAGGAAEASVGLADGKRARISTRPSASGDSMLVILTDIATHSAGS
ncbi:PAS domain-containing protein [Marinobacter zhanjiangensis]|uniref:PAS domain-containing protein n=1 Tax=Marinobacter zhanjiangensis TaxID=578215 RepID=A0ABQ3B4D8_9GAMM|nr:PAS domain-containing protein [Marinobacter zhanjiangensis]GGY74701.1 hypothetical protein GCM10007071_22340 [Marinobacter zhanjiangensis]